MVWNRAVELQVDTVALCVVIVLLLLLLLLLMLLRRLLKSKNKALYRHKGFRWMSKILTLKEFNPNELQ